MGSFALLIVFTLSRSRTLIMNDLLFYTLLIALLYYFFYYLPSQKKTVLPPLTPKPFTQATSTQTPETEPVFQFPSAQLEPAAKPTNQEDPELEKTLDQLIKNIQQLNKSLK